VAALAGVVIGAAAFLNLYRRTCFGPCNNPAVALAQDLVPRERWLALALAVLVIGLGLWPGLMLDIIRPAAEAWIARLG
jgi:NADH-quinone oxidoreductase subunit M